MKLHLRSVFLFVIYSSQAMGLWWSFETSLEQQDPNIVCRKTQSFFSTRGDFCKSKPQLISTVLVGMNAAVEECQWQFRNRRWNCSTSKNSVKKILRYDFRETAFIYAITSAGVIFSVTRACSLGELQQCGCQKPNEKTSNVITSAQQRARNDYTANIDNSQAQANQIYPLDDNSEFKWGGCSDNILYGYTVSKQLMANQARDGRSMITDHNNEAGRLAVKRYMKKECKCHGLSGSCTVRTCWKKMPHFRDVGDRLKARFDGAIKVLFSNKGDRLIKERETIKDPTDLDLVYTATSPSFCKENPSLGSHGTVGRQCNDTSMGVEGCQLLCCGRGARATKTTVVKHCQCRFMWCCRVKCKKCRQEVEVHTCA
ncbi:protein Wnt-1-like [Acropora millepora]|uniref:protein Wnt-1-like n=1 Tax=Acropora millepora TaxID=45264 RepID=UPI001CF5A1C8|nr:protein Wnt-1-like [Acropora millepora]